jgi:hypothetical protein
MRIRGNSIFDRLALVLFCVAPVLPVQSFCRMLGFGRSDQAVACALLCTSTNSSERLRRNGLALHKKAGGKQRLHRR